MGGEYADMELASFMSTSKGFMGEYVLLILWSLVGVRLYDSTQIVTVSTDNLQPGGSLDNFSF